MNTCANELRLVLVLLLIGCQCVHHFVIIKKKVGKRSSKVCTRAKVAHQAGACPNFRNMKRVGIFLLRPGWGASPSQGYPQH